MLTSTSFPVTSPTGRKIVFFLIISQLLVIGIIYYCRVSLWSVLGQYPDQQGTSSPIGTISYDVQEVIRNRKNDVHVDGALTIQNVSVKDNRTRIAIGMGITTRNLHNLEGDGIRSHMPFFRSLLYSFCQTCSDGYDYHFFLAYDYNDIFMIKESFLVRFKNQFSIFTASNCLDRSSYSLHFVKCDHTKKPAWAQNDAMMAAYLSGMEYFYRINDDTIMKTTGWTEKFISVLNQMTPPRVGVVGPKHQGGNEEILTYDFTHRTHLEIHGFYYPRFFPDWYGDKWITDVYKPGRSMKLSSVLLVHTMETGQRYKNIPISSTSVSRQIERDQLTVTRYVSSVESQRVPRNPHKVISLSLSSSAPDHLLGAVRNAQLAPIIFPGWTLRVYIADSINNSIHIPDSIITTLKRLGAQVVSRQSDETAIPVRAWNYLVADDPEVDIFLIRNPTERLSERDAAAVNDWLAKDDIPQGIHCIKDHVKHSNLNIVDGQWGAESKILKQLLNDVSMQELMTKFYTTNKTLDTVFLQTFLDVILWDKIKDSVLCHDSITCENPGSGKALPFPVVRKDKSFVGQHFHAYEVPQNTNESANVLLKRNAQCEVPSKS